MKYTKQYFIEKFTAIPTEEIGSSLLENHCALYHCGVSNYEEPTDESLMLSKLLRPVYNESLMLSKLLRPVYTDLGSCSPEVATKRHDMAIVWEINDNATELGETPKERILKALSLVTD